MHIFTIKKLTYIFLLKRKNIFAAIDANLELNLKPRLKGALNGN